ncbi:MAG: efflux RND transporter periplasmic adaptor subunit [Myxococcales bacterium]
MPTGLLARQLRAFDKVLPVDQLSTDLASLKIDRSPPSESNGGWLKWLLILGALAGLGAGGIWAYPMVEAEIFKTEVRTGVVMDVSPTLSVTSLTATGYVVAEHRSKVGSNIPGRIAKLNVKEGSLVKAGDILAELDASDLRSSMQAAQARVFSAEARVARARATLQELDVQLKRQRGLVAQGASARSALEDLEAKVATQQAEIASAQAEVKAAQAEQSLSRVRVDRMTIIAPLSGTVVTKPLDAGETVDMMTPILELVDMTSLIVEIDVPEARLALVKVGGPAEISLDAFPGQRFPGKVREIGRRINRSKATVPVKVEFAEANSDALPDMSARVSFLTQELDQQALAGPSKRVIPPKSIAQRGGQSVVFVADAGKVRSVPVKLGETTNDGVELIDGPDVGARVVLDPPSTLADGHKVKERSE